MKFKIDNLLYSDRFIELLTEKNFEKMYKMGLLMYLVGFCCIAIILKIVFTIPGDFQVINYRQAGWISVVVIINVVLLSLVMRKIYMDGKIKELYRNLRSFRTISVDQLRTQLIHSHTQEEFFEALSFVALNDPRFANCQVSGAYFKQPLAISQILESVVGMSLSYYEYYQIIEDISLSILSNRDYADYIVNETF